MTRQATWNCVGTDVSDCNNVAEVLTKAKLDYTVRKEPVYLQNGLIVPGKSATCFDYDDQTHIMGVVSNKFNICQNEDAFSFVDEISEDVKFVKAGQTYTGLVYVIAKLPDMTVLGDQITPHIILQNGHNGLHTMKTAICPLRIVCQNQFNMAFKEAQNTISIMHSSQMPLRLENAKKLMKGVAAYMDKFNEQANELYETKFGRQRCIEIIDEYFNKMISETTAQRTINTVNDQRDAFIRAYNADDNTDFQGTAWGLVNAFTDWNTHKSVKETETKNDSKFMTVTFDPVLMTQFMKHINSYAA